MKTLSFILLLSFAVSFISGQQNQVDSLKHELETTKNDTLRLVLLTLLSNKYLDKKYDSVLFFAEQQLPLAQKLNYKIDEAYALDIMAESMQHLRNTRILETLLKGIKIVEDTRSEKNILPKKYLDMIIYWDTVFIPKDRWTPGNLRLDELANLYLGLGLFYGSTMENRQKQLFYYFKAKDIFMSLKDTCSLALIYMGIGEAYYDLNQLDSGLVYSKKSYNMSPKTAFEKLAGLSLELMSDIYFKKGDYSLAKEYSKQAVHTSIEHGTLLGLGYACSNLSNIFLKQGAIDSSLYYAQKAFEVSNQMNDSFFLGDAAAALAKLYKSINNNDSALKYSLLALTIRDSINNVEKIRGLQSLDYDEQIHQQEVETAKREYKNQLKIYALLIGLGALLIIAVILLRNNRQRKKTNILLRKQKEEIQSTLTELKSTQSQLIQSEKMASLGELTAGIAHEIQNPLNFVNNFSEVNTELIDELKTELATGNQQQAIEIADDIKENEQKIIHHGKRADAIVKGMLQHSRVSTGQKELTDINALADEYLRLSYHGLRAKDKTFNATLQTDFDVTIGKINIVPQDIGRVLLNLFNNAFYAVMQRKKRENGNYEPIITVTTKKIKDKIEIKVKDNGIGIPQKAIDKIFQPFFTTKPTGQGTGLGLSLSYDITKAHGGEIKVETKEGEWAAFIIQLPV
jgi:two-component system NtrC family sensor kinase